MVTMWMSRKKHCKPMMDQRRMRRPESTSNIDGYEGKDGDDANEEKEALQADNGSTQNVED